MRPAVIFGVDEHYVRPLLVALSSLAHEGLLTADDAVVSVLHRDLPNEVASHIEAVGTALGLDVRTARVSAELERYPVSQWISPAAYLRLHLDRGAWAPTERSTSTAT